MAIISSFFLCNSYSRTPQIQTPVKQTPSSVIENTAEVNSISPPAPTKQRPIIDISEKAMILSINRRTTQSAVPEDIIERVPLTYTKEEKNDIEEDLSQHFEGYSKQDSCNKSESVWNDRAPCPSPTPNYKWKREKARRCRKMARIWNEKRARVSPQRQSNRSAVPRGRSLTFVLFEWQQHKFYPKCLWVIGLMQMLNTPIFPTWKGTFVKKQISVSLKSMH